MLISQIINEKSPSSVQRLFEFLNKGGLINNTEKELLEASAIEEFFDIKNKKNLALTQRIPKNSESLIYNFYTNFPTSEKSLSFLKDNKTFINICNSGTDFQTYFQHILENTNHHENVKIDNLEKIIVLSTIIHSSTNLKEELIEIAKKTGEIDMVEFKENLSHIKISNKSITFSTQNFDTQLDDKLNTIIQNLQSKTIKTNKPVI